MSIVINSMDTYNVRYARAMNDFVIRFYNQSEFLNTVQVMSQCLGPCWNEYPHTLTALPPILRKSEAG